MKKKKAVIKINNLKYSLICPTMMQDHFVYIGRKNKTLGLEESPLANKYRIGPDGSREEVIRKWKDDLIEQLKYNSEQRKEIERLYEILKEVGELTLLCYCHPLPCHGEVIRNVLLHKLYRERLKEINRRRKSHGG